MKPNENIQKSIQITEKRLSVLNHCSRLIFNSLYWINLNIQINFTLATFYCKSRQTLPQSQQLCDYIIEIFKMNSPVDSLESGDSSDSSKSSSNHSFKDNIYWVWVGGGWVQGGEGGAERGGGRRGQHLQCCAKTCFFYQVLLILNLLVVSAATLTIYWNTILTPTDCLHVQSTLALSFYWNSVRRFV